FESTPSKGELFDKYENSWVVNGPVDNGYSEDYKRIGKRLIEYLWETRQGKTLIAPEEIKVSFSGGEIAVTPDEVAIDDNGIHTIRTIKSGKKLS
ncbi:hypothetical protein CGH56_25820, partial [Vibrio parahaemolyticus]